MAAISALRSRFFVSSFQTKQKELHSGRAATKVEKQNLVKISNLDKVENLKTSFKKYDVSSATKTENYCRSYRG